MTRDAAAVGLLLLLVTLLPWPVEGHELRPGFLELREIGAGTYSLLWKKPAGGEIEIYIAPAIPTNCRLLFVLGLLLIVSDRWMLLKTITSFTVAHSLTLAIATLGYASAPLPPLNAAIALSILFLGPEIVRKWRGESSFTIAHPWIVAFAFGLLHGFGFGRIDGDGLAAGGDSAGPTALQRRCGDRPVVLCGRNPWLERAFRTLEISWPRAVQALPGYTVGTLGAFWTIQRTLVLIGTLR